MRLTLLVLPVLLAWPGLATAAGLTVNFSNPVLAGGGFTASISVFNSASTTKTVKVCSADNSGRVTQKSPAPSTTCITQQVGANRQVILDKSFEYLVSLNLTSNNFNVQMTYTGYIGSSPISAVYTVAVHEPIFTAGLNLGAVLPSPAVYNQKQLITVKVLSATPVTWVGGLCYASGVADTAPQARLLSKCGPAVKIVPGKIQDLQVETVARADAEGVASGQLLLRRATTDAVPKWGATVAQLDYSTPVLRPIEQYTVEATLREGPLVQGGARKALLVTIGNTGGDSHDAALCLQPHPAFRVFSAPQPSAPGETGKPPSTLGYCHGLGVIKSGGKAQHSYWLGATDQALNGPARLVLYPRQGLNVTEQALARLETDLPWEAFVARVQQLGPPRRSRRQTVWRLRVVNGNSASMRLRACASSPSGGLRRLGAVKAGADRQACLDLELPAKGQSPVLRLVGRARPGRIRVEVLNALGQRGRGLRLS